MIHEMPPLPLPPYESSSEDVYYTPSPITELRTKPSTSIPFTRPATEDWTQDYREATEAENGEDLKLNPYCQLQKIDIPHFLLSATATSNFS